MAKQFALWKRFFNIFVHVYLQISIQDGGTQLQGEIYSFCPYSDICNITAPRTLQIDGLVSCCSSCHCDEDCGLRFDCCFDHLDQYKLVEKGRIACTDHTLRTNNEEKANVSSHGYYMVQTCESGSLYSSKNRELDNKCRIKDEFGNSLISPVSSSETNLIYVNKNCAACNKLNISRIKQWNYLFVSDILRKGSVTSTEIQSDVVNELGALVYVPPDGENWSDKRCPETYVEVDSCPNKEWESLCQELRAPFQLHKMYKNIFCVLCSGKRIELINKMCQANPSKGSFSSTLTVLLNHALIDTSTLLKGAKLTKMAKSETYCPGHMLDVKSMCLPIYCPEGMLNIKDSCTYYALRWYIPLLIMKLKLVPIQETRLLVSRLKKFVAEPVNPFDWLILPCRHTHFSSVTVFYSTEGQEILPPTGNIDTDTYVTSLLVYIWKKVDKITGINPSDTIPVFHKCALEEWLVQLENETYRFDAYFDKYSNYIRDGKYIFSKWPRVKNTKNENLVRQVLYRKLTEGPVTRLQLPLRYKIILRKPFFCKQVRVPYSDVEVQLGEIRILSKNITLGTNEYLVNSPVVSINGEVVKDWNKTTFSVCIEDYDPSYVNSFGSRTQWISSFKLLVLYMLFIAHICLCTHV